MAIMREARGMSSPRSAKPLRAPLYQAATFSTILRISGEVQLRRSISRLLVRARSMSAASSQSNTPGFSRT